jgi:hypothetical protein
MQKGVGAADDERIATDATAQKHFSTRARYIASGLLV